MPKIFESPDRGATIYERELGEFERKLYEQGSNDLYESLMEAQMWGEIRRMAKTNPAMKEYTDRCIELYHLLKETK
jgi:hypothetical protein